MALIIYMVLFLCVVMQAFYNYGASRVGYGSGAPLSRKRGISLMNIATLFFAFVFPPLGVFLCLGFGWELLLNIVLTLMGHLPGVIHALCECLGLVGSYACAQHL